MDIVLVIYSVILGIVLGSFFNVYVHRNLKGEGWVKGKSRCDTCKHELSWLDLIPLISYITLKGKCRYCKCSIGKSHLISELIFGVGFGIVATFCDLNLEIIITYIVVIIVAINVISDLAEQVTLTLSIYCGVVIILLVEFIQRSSSVGLNSNLVYLIKVMLVVIIFGILSTLLQNKIGGGDFDILLLFYVSGGITCVLKSLFLGSFVGLLCIIPFMVTGKIGRKTAIPFVPILYLGYLLNLMV